ncbi:MAG TPA: branched chain amino acid aminotransferase, partial [Methanobacterium subterraneum]|nr:branched chain amino acid aminotransferase [Methanobacterium subterraneum]
MAFDESGKIWFNGEFVDWKEANVHALSHVVHYGSSVFEGIRCYNTKKGPAVFRLAEHV